MITESDLISKCHKTIKLLISNYQSQQLSEKERLVPGGLCDDVTRHCEEEVKTHGYISGVNQNPLG